MIYFIGHTDYIKIGYTNDISSRLKALQVGSPIELKMIGLIDGDMEYELFIHNKFNHLKIRGEWFKYTKEIENFILSFDNKLLWEKGYIDDKKNSKSIIYDCRIDSGLTATECANLLSVSRQAFSKMEVKSSTGRITISKISKILDAMGYEYQHRAVKKNHNFT